MLVDSRIFPTVPEQTALLQDVAAPGAPPAAHDSALLQPVMHGLAGLAGLEPDPLRELVRG